MCYHSLLDYGIIFEQLFVLTLNFYCSFVIPYYLTIWLSHSMFEGTNVHNLHNIVLCIDVCIKRPYFLLNI